MYSIYLFRCMCRIVAQMCHDWFVRTFSYVCCVLHKVLGILADASQLVRGATTILYPSFIWNQCCYCYGFTTQYYTHLLLIIKDTHLGCIWNGHRDAWDSPFVKLYLCLTWHSHQVHPDYVPFHHIIHTHDTFCMYVLDSHSYPE